MSQTRNRTYRDGWRAVNLLIRSDGSWSGRERDVCYRNDGNGRFTDASFFNGLDDAGDGRAFATLDWNGDGALDIALVSRTAPRLKLLENQPPAGAALLLELRGGREPEAIGARVELETSNGRTLTRWVEGNSGYLSQSSRRLHFALAPGERASRLTVLWPEGTRQVIDAPPQSGLHRVRPDGVTPLRRATVSPAAAAMPVPPAPAPWMLEPVPAPALKGLTFGGLTLVSFWASWCPPCREELREWTAQAAALKAAGLRVVLAVAGDSAAPGGPFPSLRPDERELSAWNIFHQHLFDRRRDLALPTGFLLDAQGRVLKVYHGTTTAARLVADARASQRPGLPFPGLAVNYAPRRDYAELAAGLAEHGLARESLAYFALAPESAETLNNHAAAWLDAGDPARAVPLLDRALELDPARTDAWVNLGAARLRVAPPSAAREAFEKALALDPEDPAAHDGLGSARYAAEDAAGAVRAFQEAVRRAPDHATYRANLGSALVAAGRLPEAIEAFEKVRDAQPDAASVANNLGILYAETGAAAKAETEFRRAVRLAPRDPDGYLNLAMLLRQKGREPEARALLQQVLRIAPDHPRAKEMLR